MPAGGEPAAHARLGPGADAEGLEAESVIALDDVTKRYGDLVAVSDASLSLRRGEFFSLLGPSGCGKTTVLRLIAGFESPTTGAIRLEGADVAGVPPYRRNVNTVFQQYALFPHLSAFDNVAFGPRARGLGEREVARRVEHMLDVVRLRHLAGRRPGQLSGGEQQRVTVARALVNTPAALLLDEPLSALDLELRRAMQLELKRIQREVGIAFLFVTHDQEEALALSDRIAVMRGGRVEQTGAPEEVYDSPATAFVASFIGLANLLPARVERVGGGRAVLRLTGGPPAEAPTSGRCFAPGDRAVLMVRPERVRLSAAEPDAGATAVPVTVVERVFQGPVLRCVLAGEAGSRIVAHLAPGERASSPGQSETAWAWWRHDDARLLPEGGGEAEADAPPAAVDPATARRP